MSHKVPDRGCSFSMALIKELERALEDTYKSEKQTLVAINAEILELVVTSE